MYICRPAQGARRLCGSLYIRLLRAAGDQLVCGSTAVHHLRGSLPPPTPSELEGGEGGVASWGKGAAGAAHWQLLRVARVHSMYIFAFQGAARHCVRVRLHPSLHVSFSGASVIWSYDMVPTGLLVPQPLLRLALLGQAWCIGVAGRSAWRLAGGMYKAGLTAAHARSGATCSAAFVCAASGCAWVCMRCLFAVYSHPGEKVSLPPEGLKDQGAEVGRGVCLFFTRAAAVCMSIRL